MIQLQIIENSLREGEYMFQVLTEASLTTADICRRSVENNGKVDVHTMQAAIAQFFDQMEKDAIEGYSINTALFHLCASAHGSTRSGKPTWGTDPTHYLEPRFTARKEFKAKLNQQSVKVIDIKQTGPQIFDAYVYSALKHIGQIDEMQQPFNTVWTKSNLRLDGFSLRVMGEPLINDWGVYFIPLEEGKPEVKVLLEDIIRNDPSELILLVPTMPQGKYYLEVRTYGDSNGRSLVKNLRTTRFKYTLNVVST